MHSHTLRRRVGAPLAALAALAGLSGASFAHEHGHAAPESTPAATAPDTSAQMVVVKDAVTGELRMPTAAELATLQTPAAVRARMAAQRTIASQPLQKFHSSGARGARMTPEFLSFTVAVQQPDGSFAQQCYESREHAEAALSGRVAPAAPSSTVPTE